MSSLSVTFVTSGRTEWTGTAQHVVVPGADGSFGILPGMQPVLSILSDGRVRIIAEDGTITEREVEGGFVSVDRDAVTIAVDQSARVDAGADTAGHSALGTAELGDNTPE